MKKIIIITVILFNLNAFGQGLKNLDKSFGINKFKLETLYSLYEKDLKYFDTNEQGVEFYIYTKSDISEVFGVNVKEIGLGFYENQLYTISIDFGIIEKQKNLKLVENIVAQYDTPKISENFNERIWVAEWITGKIYLQASEYSCSSDLTSILRCKTQLFIYSKNLKRKIPTN